MQHFSPHGHCVLALNMRPLLLYFISCDKNFTVHLAVVHLHLLAFMFSRIKQPNFPESEIHWHGLHSGVRCAFFQFY